MGHLIRERKVKADHEKLTELLAPLLEFMNEKKYNFIFAAGKDGTCARYLRGEFYDISGMLVGMAETSPQIKPLFETVNEVLNNREVNKIA